MENSTKIFQLQARIDELEAQLKHDDKTTLLNTEGFNEALLKTWNTARRNNEYIALVHIDIDRLSAANQHYGEDHVDECIIGPVGKVIASHVRRANDAAGRLFGDAYRAVFYGTDTTGAQQRAQSIINDVASLRIPNAGLGDDAIVTVTAGIAVDKANRESTSDNPRYNIDKLQRVASAQMYRAKNAGRNQARAA